MMIHDRLLKDQPKVHHAVHLATIRKQCEENPLKILKKYNEQITSTTANTTTPSITASTKATISTARITPITIVPTLLTSSSTAMPSSSMSSSTSSISFPSKIVSVSKADNDKKHSITTNNIKIEEEMRFDYLDHIDDNDHNHNEEDDQSKGSNSKNWSNLFITNKASKFMIHENNNNSFD